MNLVRIVLITTVINVPLSVYVSTFIAKPDKTQGHVQAVSVAKVSGPAVMIKAIDDTQEKEDVATLSADVNSLKVELAGLREEIRRIVSSKTNAAISGRGSDDVSVARSNEDIQAEEEKIFAAQGEALESDFRQQTIAPAWSSETEDLVRKGLLSDKISADSIVSLECRTHTCRLELADNSQNKAPDFVDFPQKVSEELPNVMMSQTESGDNTTVFYLSKEEFVLPSK